MKSYPNLLVATGWCAHKEGHNNPKRAKRQNQAEYLCNVWVPMVEAQIEKPEIFLYTSKCDIQPIFGYQILEAGEQAHQNINEIISHRSAKNLPYRHDGAASMLVSTAYALANDMDLCYIEQDCLVFGLDKAIDMAREKGGIWYGFGENSSYNPGWAANSFLYISNKFLLPFIDAMHAIKDCTDGAVKMEQMFHEIIQENVFSEAIRFWPFGCDCLRPIPWDEPIFYAQHLTDEELDKFTEKLKG